ncbi:hypothetical protein [Flavobacterium sp. XS2P39]|uniref:hypothetical protein n=1 Tax=Flavobacterium sp. XS2P39 TaxID=3401725 RepID=UPI003AAB3AE7
MELHKNITENKEEYYHLAIKYYYNINTEEYLNNRISSIIPKSISILIDHQFIPTPCIEIKIELHHKEEHKGISSYFLYVNDKKEFIDEFLISDW